MKTELNGRIPARVRQRCASVAALFYALETRMFPHFCMFRQRRQAKVPSSLKIKNIGERGRKRKEKNKRSSVFCLAKLAKLAEPLSMRVSEHRDPGAILARPWRSWRKTPLNPPNAGPLNQLRLSGLTKPGSAL